MKDETLVRVPEKSLETVTLLKVKTEKDLQFNILTDTGKNTTLKELLNNLSPA